MVGAWRAAGWRAGTLSSTDAPRLGATCAAPQLQLLVPARLCKTSLAHALATAPQATKQPRLASAEGVEDALRLVGSGGVPLAGPSGVAPAAVAAAAAVAEPFRRFFFSAALRASSCTMGGVKGKQVELLTNVGNQAEPSRSLQACQNDVGHTCTPTCATPQRGFKTNMSTTLQQLLPAPGRTFWRCHRRPLLTSLPAGPCWLQGRCQAWPREL